LVVSSIDLDGKSPRENYIRNDMKFGFHDVNHKIENMRGDLNGGMENMRGEFNVKMVDKLETMMGKIGTPLHYKAFSVSTTRISVAS